MDKTILPDKNALSVCGAAQKRFRKTALNCYGIAVNYGFAIIDFTGADFYAALRILFSGCSRAANCH